MPGRCVFSEPECRGCKRAPKVRCHRHDLVMPASACDPHTCADKLPLSGVHLGAVITARNEGDEVRSTVCSLLESVQTARVTVILIDDGSTDGSCELKLLGGVIDGRRRLTVIRNDPGIGIGGSRNAGWQAARELGCHVVSFHDAHMRFDAAHYATPGALEAMAVRALHGECLLSAASRGMPPKGVLAGCRLQFGPECAIQAKWQKIDKDGWQPHLLHYGCRLRPLGWYRRASWREPLAPSGRTRPAAGASARRR